MNFKNENGITLVALVVTIIVMVILASIAITASVGENGLINQVQTGIIKASTREIEEALDAYILLEEKYKMENGDFEEVTIEDLNEIYEQQLQITENDITYNVYKITQEGLKMLNIKGEYGNTKGVFKIKENTTTNEYEVVYED